MESFIPLKPSRGELARQLGGEVVHRAARDVVEEGGHVAGGLSRPMEVRPGVGVGGRVEPRHVGGDGVGPEVDRAARQAGGGVRARAADLGDDAQAVAGFDRAPGQRSDLVVLEQHALAGGAGDEDAVEPGVGEPADVLAERVEGDRAVLGERRGDRGQEPRRRHV